MRGQTVLAEAWPKGQFLEGNIVGTPKPGTLMEIDPTVPANAVVGNEEHYRVFQRGTDGQRTTPIILLEDVDQGKTVADAYVAGTRGRYYCPLAGERMNVLLVDTVGTSDAYPKGTFLIAATGTGLFKATTGTPQSEPFETLEDIPAPTTSTLVYSMYTGS